MYLGCSILKRQDPLNIPPSFAVDRALLVVGKPSVEDERRCADVRSFAAFT
jgi:hypothetical protein